MEVRRPSPFSRLIGLAFIHRSPERVEATLSVREDVCNARGVLHGGVVMAIGDSAGAQLTLANLAAGSHTATIESKTNFFAAVQLGDTVRAVATPLHRGRSTMVLETRISRGDGRLAAIVTQTQLLFVAEESK